MAFEKKIWKDRIAEYINRRLLTFEDGSTKLVTVARDEGTISQEGDPFSAAMMNNLEDRIQKEFDSQNLSLENCLKSVSDGKKTVAGAITEQGVNTAADAEFATMAENIGTVGINKYNGGRTQGRNDVTGAPNSYGLYTRDQYNANYNNGYNAGYGDGSSAAASNACVYAAVTNGGSGSKVAYDKNLFSVSGGTVTCRQSGNYQILKGGYCDGDSCRVKKTSNGSTSYALSDGVAIGTCWMNAGDYFSVTCNANGGNCSFVCIFAV